MRVAPRATAAGVRLVTYEVLGSTNAEAFNLARSGEHGPLWVVAARQTAGRGRRGRTWVSEPGNLHASLLLTTLTRPRVWPQLSFVAALAVHDAIEECASALGGRLAIKWPNDLVLGRAKCAGILIEGETGDAPSVVVGMGVNCSSHPADTGYPATDLAAAGTSVAPAELLAALSLTMIERLGQWNEGEGFSEVRADWIARAAGIGEDVRVRLPQRELSGCFETLDADGNMILRLPDGRAATVTAGDTVHADMFSVREDAS
jgi:BirA family biotin operon repressor/biotin-[acetyl-CoA-carboxylase] ligase